MFFSNFPIFSSLLVLNSSRGPFHASSSRAIHGPRAFAQDVHGPKLAEVCMRQAVRLEEMQAELEKAMTR